MKLHALTITNFRCFNELTVKLHPQLTVIVGDNGIGKTAILDAIALGISPFIGSFNQGKKKDIQVDDVRMTTDSMGQVLFNHPTRIELNGNFNEQEQSWAIVRKTQKGRSTISEAKKLINYGKNLQSFSLTPDNVDLPLIRYYGVCRYCKEIKLAIPKQNPRKYAERDAGYIDCLESVSTFDVFQGWFIAITFQVFEYEKAMADGQVWENNRKKVAEHWKLLLDTVCATINTVLRHTGWQDIKYNATLQKLVMFHHEKGILGIDQLSSGIKTTVALVADLAYRIVKLNPYGKEEAIRKTNGIVLIDEIDLHLHPSWQQHIIRDLVDTFPSVQFVITTHSPQVLTTIKRENIRILSDGDSGQIITQIPRISPLGHESGDALSYVMQVPVRPSMSFDDDLKIYEQMVRNGDEETQDAQTIKKRLDELGYEFSHSDLQTWRFLASRKKVNT